MLDRCLHTDVRDFDRLRSCLACGDTWFRNPPDLCDSLEQAGPYYYTDLRCLKMGRTIRLVVVAPGEDPEPLHCTLKLWHIHARDYHAVSYTWATEEEDDVKSQAVYVDGCVMYVTKNCEAVLRRFRRLGVSGAFWIDAMCINQDCVQERNHQVGLMDHIYRNAERVHICIEDPKNDHGNLVRRLQSQQKYSPSDDGLRTDLQTVFRCRYFGRVWVIQEVALAEYLTLHVNADHARLTPWSVNLIRCLCPKIPGPFKSLTAHQETQSIRQRLRTSLNASCTDPRDKIYAILSLLDEPTRCLIPVDYMSEVHCVYTKALIACIASERNLNILQFAKHKLLTTAQIGTTYISVGTKVSYLESLRAGWFRSWFPGICDFFSKSRPTVTRGACEFSYHDFSRYVQYPGPQETDPYMPTPPRWKSRISLKLETQLSEDANSSAVHITQPLTTPECLMPAVEVYAHILIPECIRKIRLDNGTTNIVTEVDMTFVATVNSCWDVVAWVDGCSVQLLLRGGCDEYGFEKYLVVGPCECRRGPRGGLLEGIDAWESGLIEIGRNLLYE